MIKQLIRKTPVYGVIYKIRLERRNRLHFRAWERSGKPVPPPHVVKELTLREYARRFRLDTLIETGTCYGDMVYAMKDSFQKIYSIELSAELARHSQARFSKQKNVRVIHGDSPSVLLELLPTIGAPSLVWLDAHYSAGISVKGELDTPVRQELNAILGDPNRQAFILIDDARDFNGHNGYPTIDELEQFVKQLRPEWVFEIKDDIIRFHPREKTNNGTRAKV